MAKKTKTSFVCNECGDTFPKWMGRCTSCGAFNTIVEFKERADTPGERRKSGVSAGLEASEVQLLAECATSVVSRISTGFPEVDTVLGGGIVTGSMTLIGGAPGIGKSTLMLQIACGVATGGSSVLYVSGEESVDQLALRARRLEVVDAPLKVLTETSVEQILATVEKHQPHLLVIDSIQTLFTDAITSAPGSVSQVRECTAMLMGEAKRRGLSLVIIGHVTKDGTIAGPRVLMVEVQALVSASHFGLPQRVASGINPKKLALIVAVLEKYAGVQLGDFDIFLNITGGLNISETAVDLAVAASLLSSFRNRPIPKGTSFVGELGLGGELRPVADMEKRIREVAAMGFERVVTPPLRKKSAEQVKNEVQVFQCAGISQFEQILD